jgi:hypothetical protein
MNKESLEAMEGFFVFIWIVSWYGTIWVDKFRIQFFLTSLSSLILAVIIHTSNN